MGNSNVSSDNKSHNPHNIFEIIGLINQNKDAILENISTHRVAFLKAFTPLLCASRKSNKHVAPLSKIILLSKSLLLIWLLMMTYLIIKS